jgi:hypothetical protein
MMPKEIIDNFLASSSMLNWRGVRFSSTCPKVSMFLIKSSLQTYILHHGKDHTKLCLSASGYYNTHTATL